LLKENGPDFLINNFCVNYAYPVLVFGEGDQSAQREWNTDLKNSMDLMDAIGAQLNTPYAQYDYDTTRPRGVSRKGLFVIRDTLFTKTYEAAISGLTKAFEPKLDYDPIKHDKYGMLVSTNMEPWSTAKGFLNVFRTELREAILRAIGQLKDLAAVHSFVIVDASDAEVFGEHVSSFRSAPHNYQTIAKFEFGLEDPETKVVTGNESVKYAVYSVYRQKLAELKTFLPLVISTKTPEIINDLLYREDNNQWFEADIWVGEDSPRISLGTQWLRVSDIILHKHFDPAALYPANEQYYVFGSADDKVYASHIITKYPNFHQLIQLDTTPPGISDLLRELGLEVTLAGVTTDADRTKSPLQPGFTYSSEFVREDNEPFASSFTVKRQVWFDTGLNTDTMVQKHPAQPHQHQRKFKAKHTHRRRI